MLCQNVNRALQIAALCLLSPSVFAAASIEKTVIAYYDLSNHRSEHHEMTVTNQGGQGAFMFKPIDTPAVLPATFAVTGCINAETPTLKKILLTVTVSSTDAKDKRLTSIGDFAIDHYLRAVLIPLSNQQYLFFGPDTEGLMVTDSLPLMKRCR